VTDLEGTASGGPTDDARSPMAEAKRRTRAEVRSARDGMAAEIRGRGSAAASLRAIEAPEVATARVVLAYFALPAEIDPLAAVWAMRRRGATIAYPRVEAPGILGVYAVDDERDLVPGTFGLSHPGELATPVELHHIDVVIVPGMAFDERGRRLGYGGGYYDRLLPRLRPDCARVGVAFDEQILAEIPAEPHDGAVDLIVTPTRTIRPSAGRT
jgi:5-formyltetrahydrofolate cyclo-ligase